jgi:polyhydroxyalkanoate synthesis regulator phasin
MIAELKRLFLAAVGSAAVTYEKATKLVDEMVEKGKLTVDEGKELTEELKKTIQSKKEDLMPLTKEDLREILNEMSFASKEDLYEVKERLNRIEDTFDQMEKEKFEE